MALVPRADQASMGSQPVALCLTPKEVIERLSSQIVFTGLGSLECSQRPEELGHPKHLPERK